MTPTELRFALAERFLKDLGVSHRLVPCTTVEYPRPAERPANSILDCRRLRQEGLLIMVPWQEDVDRFAAEFGSALLDGARGGQA